MSSYKVGLFKQHVMVPSSKKENGEQHHVPELIILRLIILEQVYPNELTPSNHLGICVFEGWVGLGASKNPEVWVGVQRLGVGEPRVLWKGEGVVQTDVGATGSVINWWARWNFDGLRANCLVNYRGTGLLAMC